MSEALVLWGTEAWDSPYFLSAYVALVEKQLPFTVETISLAQGEQRAPEYLRHSLTGKIPTLQHGEYFLSESAAIAEYLAETFPFPTHPRLFPADLKERGRCRQLQHWLRSDFLALRQERPTSSVFRGAPVQSLTEAGRADAARLLAAVEPLLSHGRRHLFEAWCIADCDLAMMLMRLVHHGDPVPELVRSYALEQWKRPSIQQFCQASARAA